MTAAPELLQSDSSPAKIIAIRHHWLVRCSHWLNVLALIGLVMSGLSIYWASPVFKHPYNARTGSADYVADAGLLLGSSRGWIYDKFGLGTYALSDALQLHWLFAYLFMLCGLLYGIGLVAGGGWRGLAPRRGQAKEAARMQWYYAGLVPMKLLRRSWRHPETTGKYNALQRTAYASMPIAGLLAVASGWAMHKPVQLGWLERCFVSYDGARIVHFVTMLVFIAFVIPHVILGVAEGWDTLRSMVAGWSARIAGMPEEMLPVTVVAAEPPAVEPVVESVMEEAVVDEPGVVAAAEGSPAAVPAEVEKEQADV